MQKIILRIAVFTWVLVSAITWADGMLYVHKPGESFQGVQAVPRNYIDYSRYLSPAVQIDIGRQFAQAEVARQVTRQDTVASEQTFKVLFLPQEKYEEMLALKASPQASATAVFLPSGNIRCNSLRPQRPHLGKREEDGPRVPKAKSAGNCEFIHTGPGPAPPTLTLELRQELHRLPNFTGFGQILSNQGQAARIGRPSIVWKASHTKSGLTASSLSWSARNTQVFGYCSSPSHWSYNGAHYKHLNEVFITAPSGWVYIGPNPLPIAIEETNYFKCWK